MNISKGVKASFVYTISSLLSKGLAIITVPIFTRLMPTEQMGVVNLYNSWHSMIGAFATLSLTSGGYMLAMKEYKNNRDQYMSSVLALTSIVAGIIAIIYFIGQSWLNGLLGLSKPLIILMLFGFFVTPATDFWLARQRYEYKYLKAGIVMIVSSILASIFSVLAVIVAANKGITNLAEIRLVSTYLVIYSIAIVLWIYIMFKGKTYIKTDYWKFSLKLSIPLIGNSVAMQVLSVSDRSMISKMIGNSEVGIYGVLYTVSSLSLIIWGAINSSFVPFLFEKIDDSKNRSKIQSVSSSLMLVYGAVAFLMTLVAPEIVRVLATEEYYEAIYIMPPIAAGVFFTSISNLYSNILIYYKKTNVIMISSIIAAIVNLCLNYIFIKLWGYMAAAYTTLIAYVILAIVQSIVANSVIRKREDYNNSDVYDNSKLLLISVCTTALCLSALLLYPNSIIRYIAIAFVVIVCIVFHKKIINVIKIK